jgi:hypothetical protein
VCCFFIYHITEGGGKSNTKKQQLLDVDECLYDRESFQNNLSKNMDHFNKRLASLRVGRADTSTSFSKIRVFEMFFVASAIF